MAGELSPLDGRYRGPMKHLEELFSEQALMRARCRVELSWVEALTEAGLFDGLDPEEQQRVTDLHASFGRSDYERIKAIEAKIKHDVKACERFLVERLELRQPHVIHFGLTSEDVNNLAYSLMLEEYRVEAQLPLLRELMGVLAALARAWKAVPFPARTHGQLASPTTAGKEIAVFLNRLLRQYKKLKELRFTGKLNGATGNYSALVAAFPDVDWPDLSERFVAALGLQVNPVTTQIEDHDTWAEYFALVARINNIVLDLNRDCWAYISRGYFMQRTTHGEVGSSTMPHKVNPINFENSEGNLVLSTSLLHTLSDKLCCSRMQRDLSDSTVERNIGVALGHGHLAVTETLKGLRKVGLDETACGWELENSPELLSEPYQTILKTAGVEDPYELLRQASRGTRMTMEDLKRTISGLELEPEVESRLAALRVTEYVGLAEKICEKVLEDVGRELAK